MKKHEHSGGGSSHFSDPSSILRTAGVRAGDILLDLGCGKGAFSLAASGLTGPSGKIYALDIYEDSIRELQKTIKEKSLNNIETVVADAVKTIPLPDKSIDICIMSNVLHGFVANSELPGIMANLEKIMKRESRLVIIEFKKSLLSFGPPFSIKLNEEELKKTLEIYGYEALSGFKPGPFHYGIVLSRRNISNL